MWSAFPTPAGWSHPPMWPPPEDEVIPGNPRLSCPIIIRWLSNQQVHWLVGSVVTVQVQRNTILNVEVSQKAIAMSTEGPQMAQKFPWGIHFEVSEFWSCPIEHWETHGDQAIATNKNVFVLLVHYLWISRLRTHDSNELATHWRSW